MRISMLTNADIHKVDLVPAGAQQFSKIEIMKAKEDTVLSDVKKQELTDEELKEVETLLNQLKAKLGVVDTPDEAGKAMESTDGADAEKACGAEKECDGAKEGCDKPEGESQNEAEKAEDKKEDNVVEEKKEEGAAPNADLAKMADIVEKNRQLLDEVEKMKDEKATNEFVAKAAEYKNIPGVSTQELGMILKSVNGISKETYEKLESILKSANEAIGSGSLFVEKGSSVEQGSDPTTKDEAYSMLEKMAESRVKKGESDTSNCMADVLSTPEGARLYQLYKSLN